MISRHLFFGKSFLTALLILFLFGVFWYWQVLTGSPWSTQQSEEYQDTAVSVQVIRIIDGDTFEIEGAERVRLIGVDTPESVQSDTPVECYARESSEYLKELIEGKTVKLVRDTTNRDQYGRLLRYVYLDGIFVNEKIVREGYAQSVAYRPDTRLQSQLDRAEQVARRDSKGRWNTTLCP